MATREDKQNKDVEASKEVLEAEQRAPLSAISYVEGDEILGEAVRAEIITPEIREKIQNEMGYDHIELFKKNLAKVEKSNVSRQETLQRAFVLTYGRFRLEQSNPMKLSESSLMRALGAIAKFKPGEEGMEGRSEVEVAASYMDGLFRSSRAADAYVESEIGKRKGGRDKYKKNIKELEASKKVLDEANDVVGKMDRTDDLDKATTALRDAIEAIEDSDDIENIYRDGLEVFRRQLIETDRKIIAYVVRASKLRGILVRLRILIEENVKDPKNDLQYIDKMIEEFDSLNIGAEFNHQGFRSFIENRITPYLKEFHPVSLQGSRTIPITVKPQYAISDIQAQLSILADDEVFFLNNYHIFADREDISSNISKTENESNAEGEIRRENHQNALGRRTEIGEILRKAAEGAERLQRLPISDIPEGYEIPNIPDECRIFISAYEKFIETHGEFNVDTMFELVETRHKRNVIGDQSGWAQIGRDSLDALEEFIRDTYRPFIDALHRTLDVITANNGRELKSARSDVERLASEIGDRENYSGSDLNSKLLAEIHGDKKKVDDKLKLHKQKGRARLENLQARRERTAKRLEQNNSNLTAAREDLAADDKKVTEIIGRIKTLQQQIKTKGKKTKVEKFKKLFTGLSRLASVLEKRKGVLADTTEIDQVLAEISRLKLLKNDHKKKREVSDLAKFLTEKNHAFLQSENSPFKARVEDLERVIEKLEKELISIDNKYKGLTIHMHAEIDNLQAKSVNLEKLTPEGRFLEKVFPGLKFEDRVTKIKGFEANPVHGFEHIIKQLKEAIDYLSSATNIPNLIKARTELGNLLRSGSMEEDMESLSDISTQAKALHEQMETLFQHLGVVQLAGIKITDKMDKKIDIDSLTKEFGAIELRSQNFNPQELLDLYAKFQDVVENSDKTNALIKDLQKAEGDISKSSNLSDSEIGKKIIKTGQSLIDKNFKTLPQKTQDKFANVIIAEGVQMLQTEESYRDTAKKGSAELFDTVKTVGFQGKLINFKYTVDGKDHQPFKGLTPKDFETWERMEELFNLGKLNYQNGFFALAAFELFAEGGETPKQVVELRKKLMVVLAKELGVDERMDEAGVNKIVNDAFKEQVEKARPIIAEYFKVHEEKSPEWQRYKIDELQMKLSVYNEQLKLGKIDHDLYKLKCEQLCEESRAYDVADRFTQSSTLSGFWNHPHSQWMKDKGYEVGSYTARKVKAGIFAAGHLYLRGLWGGTKLAASTAWKTATRVPLRAVKNVGILALTPIKGLVNLKRWFWSQDYWSPFSIKKNIKEDAQAIGGFVKEKAAKTGEGTVAAFKRIPGLHWSKEQWKSKKYSERTNVDAASLESQAEELAKAGEGSSIQVESSPFIDMGMYNVQLQKLDKMTGVPDAQDAKAA